MACKKCGADLRWSLETLERHREMISHGLHAACACDDDCAVEVTAWTPDELASAMAAAHAAGAYLGHYADSRRSGISHGGALAAHAAGRFRQDGTAEEECIT